MIAFYLQLKSVLSLIIGYLILNIQGFPRIDVKLCWSDDMIFWLFHGHSGMNYEYIKFIRSML